MEADLNTIAFYTLAGMSLSAALTILLSRNVVRSIFLLVIVFVGVAGIYMISNAEFVAITQILVYAAGVLILLMFGIMLSNRLQGQELKTGHKRLIPAAAAALLLLWMLSTAVIAERGQLTPKDSLSISPPFRAMEGEVPAPPQLPTATKKIGVNLMTDQVLPLELTAVLLLAALVGAAFIVGNKKDSE